VPRLIAPLSAEERAGFIAAARSYLGVPFKHRGRSARGIDCVGLVAVALAAVGRQIADEKAYGRDPVRDGLRDRLIAHLGSPVTDYQPGDVLLLRWHMAGPVHLFNHVAIATDCPYGGLNMIHALAQNKAVVEHRIGEPWPRRIVEAFHP
jgi:cell wall-associated NlpC family hydrolase